MSVKNLLKRFEKVFFFILISILSFVVFNSQQMVVLGQEDADSTTSTMEAVLDVEDFKADDFTSDQALLFVQDTSEASQDLLDYVETFKDQETEIFHLYVVDVPKTGSVFTEYQALYKTTCEVDEILVPVLIYKEVCVFGYDEISTELAVRFKLEAENAELKESISEDLAVIDSAVEEYNADIESKTTIDWLKSLDAKTYIIIGVCVLIAIVVVVLLVVFKDKLKGKKKLISSVVPVFIVLASTGYLLFEINNTQKDFSPLESSAGCIEEKNCATWADRMADGLSSGDVEERQKFEGYQEQMKKDEEAFGSNAAHLQTTSPSDDGLYTDILAMDQNETFKIGTITYNRCSTGLCQGTTPVNISSLFTSNSGSLAGSTITTSKGKVIDSATINQFLSSSGFIDTDGNGVSDIREAAIDAARDFEKFDGKYCIKDNEIVDCYVCDCGQRYETAYCCDELKLVEEGTAEGTVRFDYDPISGEVVVVPNGKAYIDPCEGGTGNNILAPLLCNCGNGIYTTAYTGTCDAVCRVEDIICDTCNPPEPPAPPEIEGEPYCGDGILGNTTGEECEYGDPSGVTCSWNVCDSNCECPVIDEPYCGDGIFGNTAGEECEVGNPDGVTCAWEDCNHVICKCVEPGCGDGILDDGEQCERDNPDGFTCLWETECDQQSCSCPDEPSPYCGDGNLDSGELCEVGNPDGVTCTWDECSKVSCSCPETPDVPTTPGGSSPQTALFESTQARIIAGFLLMVLGFFLTPFTKILSNYYMKVSDGVVRVGKKKFEDKVLGEDKE